jgi:hypothetical protein
MGDAIIAGAVLLVGAANFVVLLLIFRQLRGAPQPSELTVLSTEVTDTGTRYTLTNDGKTYFYLTL